MDDTLQKEQVLKEIEGLTGQINLLNKQLETIDELEQKRQISTDIEEDRKKYLHAHPDIMKMYQDKSISPKGYQLLQTTLEFKNKDEVRRWLDEQN